MRDFIEWLIETTSSVSIDDRELRRIFQKEAMKVIDRIHDRHHQASNFNPQQFFQTLQKELYGYPLLPNLMKALQSKNQRYIFDQQGKLRDWLYKQPRNFDLLTLSRQIYTYIDYLDQHDTESGEKQVWQAVEQAIIETAQEMQKLKSTIEQAIGRIPNWSGTPVIINPSASSSQYGGYDITPTNSAEITLHGGEMSPQFMVFQGENGLEIDDILEGGDTDFFQSPQIQNDYFNLINELRRPGSTNKGKILTLFTARPVTDRQQFAHQKTLPINIFLTNNYDNAEGIAMDFGKRDIWKVRVDSRYLTQTLDGKIKHYQITVPNIPIVSMELITPAE